jgi:hypothetical protein
MQVADQMQAVRKLVEGYYKDSLVWDYTMPPMTSDQGQHIIQIGTSILCTKWGIGYSGGSFVQAVVDNDLMAAVDRADGTNIKMLPFYCKLIYNVGMPMELAEAVK